MESVRGRRGGRPGAGSDALPALWRPQRAQPLPAIAQGGGDDASSQSEQRAPLQRSPSAGSLGDVSVSSSSAAATAAAAAAAAARAPLPASSSLPSYMQPIGRARSRSQAAQQRRRTPLANGRDAWLKSLRGSNEWISATAAEVEQQLLRSQRSGSQASLLGGSPKHKAVPPQSLPPAPSAAK
jgi:hypothetical protein